MMKSGMTAMKKVAFPLLACGWLWATGVYGQDIIGFRSDIANQKFTTPGGTVSFVVRLKGAYTVTNTIPGYEFFRPQMRVKVGSDSSMTYATLQGWTSAGDTDNPRTDLTFAYTIRAGDMAAPFKVYGGKNPDNTYSAYSIFTSGWDIRNATNGASVVWQFGAAVETLDANDGFKVVIGASSYPDSNLELRKIHIETLSFTEPYSLSVAAMESVTWGVALNAGALAGSNSPISLVVWTPQTNLLQLGSTPQDPSRTIYIEAGANQSLFTLKGLSNGTATVYVQRASDYNLNGTLGVTNFLSRTISVTPPSAPTVRVLLGDTSAETLALNETTEVDTGKFKVTISEPYTNDVYVSVNLAQASSGETNVTPTVVGGIRIPQGQTETAFYYFNAVDGTALSKQGATGVTVTPAVTNTAYYSRVRTGQVYVNNVKPAMVVPNSSTPILAAQHEPCTIDWEVNDVDADCNSATQEITWYFGPGTTNQTFRVAGRSGQLTTTFTRAGTFDGWVRVKDKDGSTSVQSAFTVTVSPATPKPSVTVVPNGIYSETNGIANFWVVLSESYTHSITVGLSVAQSDTNVVLMTTNVVINAGYYSNAVSAKVSLLDGTANSENIGIVVSPTIADAAIAAIYPVANPAYIAVLNAAPVITSPTARDPSLGAVSPYNKIELNKPFTFNHTIRDVQADLAAGVLVEWQFGDNTPWLPGTGFGTTGSIAYTFTMTGTQTVRVRATDKDGGVSAVTEFPVNVILPKITVQTSSYAQFETDSAQTFTVSVSEPYTSTFKVRLNVTPATNAINGAILLVPTNELTFTAGQTTQTARYVILDGTDNSFLYGFTITPEVMSGYAATNFYKEFEAGSVQIANVAPTILNPTASDPTTTTPSRTLTMALEEDFSWNVSDVAADGGSNMTITWKFGDDTTIVTNGLSGSVRHAYPREGDFTIQMTARDKDGGTASVLYRVTVKAVKTILATPLGPNKNANYWGSIGLGDGIITANTTTWKNEDDVYTFRYSTASTYAELMATPYKVGGASGTYIVTNYNSAGVAVPGAEKDKNSYFFVWEGPEDAFSNTGNLDPSTASQKIIILLPDATAGDAAKNAREIRAIFSREYKLGDNDGDINMDGIPDKMANAIFAQIKIKGGLQTTASVPYWLQSLTAYNDDGDYLPLDPYAVNGTYDFRPVASGGSTNNGQTAANAFSAIYEVRGFDGTIGRTSGGINDDPGTLATEWDSDGDGFPDGWEYWFWYQASIPTTKLTGSRFNVANISQGTVIAAVDVVKAFVPYTSRKTSLVGSAYVDDFDNDGLLDAEELVLGTNPIHWDTDGDGMCDGWEVRMGLNPRLASDGMLPTNNNQDGDYFAISMVSRQWVTVLSTNGSTVVTNTYLGQGAVGGTNLTGTFTTWYRYGDDTAPLAVGRPTTIPSNTLWGASPITIAPMMTNALVLHFQVRDEFGFDPRTAWIGAIPRFGAGYANGGGAPTNWPSGHAAFARFGSWVPSHAPNTRPFTSVDEYLLMKFMSENRLNGAGTNMTRDVWSTYSTHPLSPDSDASKSRIDGVPDGWELYVATRQGSREFVNSPWNPEDYNNNEDPVNKGDGLTYQREFWATDSLAHYTNAVLYYEGMGTNAPFTANLVTITRPAGDAQNLWLNKFWPTDPWNPDTDGDGVQDGGENTFVYGTPADNGSVCIAGAGLNPNSVDTDRDALPDAWEVQFAGAVVAGTPPALPTIPTGMNGTVPDAMADWDKDGLENYQEYWTQAIRAFRYDLSTNTIPIDATFDVTKMFVVVSNTWDQAQFGWPTDTDPLWIQMPASKLYATTSPNNADSDFDIMDDYYELYHGLNPLLGYDFLEDDLVHMAYGLNSAMLWDNNPFWSFLSGSIPLDFVRHPWTNGRPRSDADADGLLNLEEMLVRGTAEPQNHNTDPSPIWFTDPSNSNSLTARFYVPWTGASPMFFWPATEVPDFMYSFEMNEGYDTDNDGVSDKDELVGTRNPKSDPQDQSSPLRRQALWFSGANSAACTPRLYSMIDSFAVALAGDVDSSFRSFTVEMWVRPEQVVTTTGQVLIERTFEYAASDNSQDPNQQRLRRNFFVGIAPDGRVYAGYDNAGGHDEHTDSVRSYGHVLSSNQWTHVAARMDGHTQTFQIFIDGQPEEPFATSLIPATGIDPVRYYPTEATNQVGVIVYRRGSLVLGAANNSLKPLDMSPYMSWNSMWADYDQFYKGWMDEVRIWDGARSDEEIKANHKKRFTREEALANRQATLSELQQGYNRVSSTNRLSPFLMAHYSFGTLFSAVSATDVATVPRGFNNVAMVTNRPGDAAVQWWKGAAVRNNIYSDYQYLPWIENTVEHLPLSLGLSTTTNAIGFRDYILSDRVSDSVYWTLTSAGGIAGTNTFPNSNNPYGFEYTRGTLAENRAGERGASDLLPLGNAFAKQCPDYWDGVGPTTSWLETGLDGNDDGLPNWWETLHYGGVTSAGGWNATYTGSSALYLAMGLTNGEIYQRELAKGMQPSGVIDASFAQTADTDGDGLPDWWEKIFGLSPTDATGSNGSGGDPDKDALSNLSEYMISEVYTNLVRYSSPQRLKTSATQPVSDYFMKPNATSKLTFGAMFSDHDFMDDVWEDLYPINYISRYRYDPHLDNDLDGWSNFAEARYSSALYSIRPDLNGHPMTNSTVLAECPIPTVNLRLNYRGLRGLKGSGNVIVNAYKNSTMDGIPDAMWKTNILMDSTSLLLRVPNEGYLREGTNYFFACMDVNNNGTWDAGEPCGVATPFATTIGWDTQNINIQLTDYTLGYLRMTLSPAVRSDDIYLGQTSAGSSATTVSINQRVRIRRISIDGVTETTLPGKGIQRELVNMQLSNRNYIHEGDVLGYDWFAFDWGFYGYTGTTLQKTNAVYEVYVGTWDSLMPTNRILTFTAIFDYTQEKANSIKPAGGEYVYSARPTFRWSMPERYPAFAIEVKRGGSSGTTIYQSGVQKAPLRDPITGECIWEAPLHAPNGTTTSNNTIYAWRVMALNSKFSTPGSAPATTWSDWKSYRWDLNQTMQSSGYGEIRSVVKYFGPATTLDGRVVVQAFGDRGFTGVPAAQFTMTDVLGSTAKIASVTNPATSATNVVLRGLAPGTYYLRAFIDSNNNGVRDAWESWGYANYYGTATPAYDVRPLEVSFTALAPVGNIYIEDCDTDQDWFPDAWEYEQNPSASNFLELIAPLANWTHGDSEINPDLTTATSGTGPGILSMMSVLAFGTTDQDSDGLNDMSELLLGTNPMKASTLGSGFTDGSMVELGLAPTDQLTFNVTSLDFDQGKPIVKWQVNLQRDLSFNRPMLGLTTLAPASTTQGYCVEYATSLSAADWTPVQTGTIQLDGSKSMNSPIDIDANKMDPAKGFFRVRLISGN